MVQKVGSVLDGKSMRNLGGVLDGTVIASSVEADGYVNLVDSDTPLLTWERTDTGVFTGTFTRVFPRVTAVVVTPVLVAAAATKVDLVSFSTTEIVVRVADTATNGAAKNPADDDGFCYHVYFQNSKVNPQLE